MSLFFLKKLIDHSVFGIDKLKEKEKKKIIEFFSNIDTSLAETPNYRIVKSNIERLKTLKAQVRFNDYEMNDINKKPVKLSDVIRKNQITVLDFWWSGCRPCRQFNRETSSMYDSLKKVGIEIVAINIDESKERWKEASLKDNIKWINLYSGAASDMTVKYNVNAYPTHLVFDKNQNLIDFKFKEADELFALIKK